MTHPFHSRRYVRFATCIITLFGLALFTPMFIRSSAATASPLRTGGVPGGYEIWLTDQNNTAGYSAGAPRGTHGGRLLIYDSAALDNPGGPVDNPTILDMAEMFAIGSPHNPTGPNVVRPHTILPSPDGRYMALAFVASGHVAIIDGATKQPKALFRMSPGADSARQAHAATWLTDGSALLVANQNGKLLERINYDAATDSFSHDQPATLNLVTCTTPSGKPCQSATPVNAQDPLYLGPDNRPDNAPICPVISERNTAFVTLRGGGLFVVDAKATPLAIVAAYGNAFVGRDGCGGVQDKKNVYLNGGTGTLTTNPMEFSLYHFRDEYPRAPNALPDNDPLLMPKVFFRAGSANRDAHGMAKTAGTVHYLWQFDRMANVAEVFRLPSKKHIRTVDLTASGVSSDPTSDLVTLSPNGDRFYVALRGPKPQTAGHAAHGSSPGLGIVTLSDDGANGSLTLVLPTSFINPIDGSQESDPHGAAARRK